MAALKMFHTHPRQPQIVADLGAATHFEFAPPDAERCQFVMRFMAPPGADPRLAGRVAFYSRDMSEIDALDFAPDGARPVGVAPDQAVESWVQERLGAAMARVSIPILLPEALAALTVRIGATAPGVFCTLSSVRLQYRRRDDAALVTEFAHRAVTQLPAQGPLRWFYFYTPARPEPGHAKRLVVPDLISAQGAINEYRLHDADGAAFTSDGFAAMAPDGMEMYSVPRCRRLHRPDINFRIIDYRNRAAYCDNAMTPLQPQAPAYFDFHRVKIDSVRLDAPAAPEPVLYRKLAERVHAAGGGAAS